MVLVVEGFPPELPPAPGALGTVVVDVLTGGVEAPFEALLEAPEDAGALGAGALWLVEPPPPEDPSRASAACTAWFMAVMSFWNWPRFPDFRSLSACW